jgi:L-malate glycosyltransferase
MKILHIITSLKIGGAESALCNFLEHDANNNCSHRVLYFYAGPNLERLKNLKFETKQITGILSPYDPIAFLSILNEIRKYKPDIIHAALWSATIIGRLAGSLFRIPVICDIHGDCSHHGKLRNYIDRFTIRFVKHFVPVAPSVKDSFVKTFGPRNNISVINNGIDTRRLREKASENPLCKKNLGLNSSDFIIGTIGRLHPIKRYDLLIEAFHEMSKECTNPNKIPKLCIIGGGSEEKTLKILVLKLKIQNQVIFFGERTDAYRFYPIFNCFVLSSATEGLSIALLEALSFGIPIITTNATKKHDVLENEKHGIIIPPLNKKSLKEALIQMYNHDDQRKMMSNNNLDLAETKFRICKTVDEYHELYKLHISSSKQNDY